MASFFYCRRVYRSSSISFLLASRFNFQFSYSAPPIQYGIKEIKNIINQNPMVKMVRNAKNPRY